VNKEIPDIIYKNLNERILYVRSSILTLIAACTTDESFAQIDRTAIFHVLLETFTKDGRFKGVARLVPGKLKCQGQ
jgi:hypothetical protein